MRKKKERLKKMVGVVPLEDPSRTMGREYSSEMSNGVLLVRVHFIFFSLLFSLSHIMVFVSIVAERRRRR